MATLEELRRKHQELINSTKGGNSSGSGNALDKYLKLEQGKNVIRILPGKKDKMEFYAESAIHRYEDAEGNIRNYHCRKVQNEHCPVCEFYFDLWKMHKDLGLEKGKKSKFGDMATKIKANPRYYMNVIDRRLQESGSDPVKIFSTGKKLFAKIMADVLDQDYMDDKDPVNSLIIDLKNGNDYIVDLGKNGEYNSYDNSKVRTKKSPAGTNAEMAAWMESAIDLSTLIQMGDYDTGKQIVATLLASLSPSPSVAKKGNDVSDDDYETSLEA